MNLNISKIPGIVFDASIADSLGDFSISSTFNQSENGNYQIANIFSSDNIFTGIDENCYSNGILPKRYYFPNVYDTACLTAISCSETMKYVPFCKQVLSNDSNKSIEEFEKSLNAYLKHYGST